MILSAKTRLTVLATTAALALGGCMVGPNYAGPPSVAPHAEAGGHFQRADQTAAGDAPAGQWWTAFGDPELNRLEDAALASNPDVEVATARLRESRAGLKQAQAGLYPNTNASALLLHTKGLTSALSGGAGGAGGQQQGSDTLDFYDAGIDATWQVDLFGGQRRAIQGARAQSDAANDNLDAAKVALAAEVAQAYVSLRDLQQRLALSQRDVALETQLLDLTEKRRSGGDATDLDVVRLRVQLQSSEANATPLKAQIDEQLDRLAILTGQEPGALDVELATAAAIPAPPATVAVGDPAALLRRRPDVRAAERAIAQKTALIGQRTADLFPKVELLGNLGFGSTNLSNLFSAASFSYIGAPVLQWSPFDFGRTKAKIEEAKGERDEALAEYRKTVLGALQDAETAISRYGHQRDAVTSLAAVAVSSDRAARLVDLKAADGTADTLDRLDAERQRVKAEADLSQAQGQLTEDFVAVEKSLGLAWAS